MTRWSAGRGRESHISRGENLALPLTAWSWVSRGACASVSPFLRCLLTAFLTTMLLSEGPTPGEATPRALARSGSRRRPRSPAGCTTSLPHSLEGSPAVSQNAEHSRTLRSTVPLLGAYPHEQKTYVHTKSRPRTCPATFLITAEPGRQPRCPSVGDGMNCDAPGRGSSFSAKRQRAIEPQKDTEEM